MRQLASDERVSDVNRWGRNSDDDSSDAVDISDGDLRALVVYIEILIDRLSHSDNSKNNNRENVERAIPARTSTGYFVVPDFHNSIPELNSRIESRG